MDHEIYKNNLILHVYGELSEESSRELERHLESCAECRGELGRLNTIKVNAGSLFCEADDRLLFEARTRLHNTLASPVRRTDARPGFLNLLLSALLSPRYRFTYAGLVLLVAGAVIGYSISRRVSVDVNTDKPASGQIDIKNADNRKTSGESDVKVEDLQFQDSDASDGEVEFTFNAVKPVRMKGRLDNAMIQKVLVQSLQNSGNDGERLRALNKIAAHASSQPGFNSGVALSPRVKNALINTVKHDANPGVRREALMLLEKCRYDSQIENALLYVLNNDKNSGLRIAAIKAVQNGLASGTNKNIDRDLIETLKEKSTTDGNDYVKISARTVLQEVISQ